MEIKKSLALLAGAGALLAFTPVASHAQDAATGAAAGPFADVPADHWAYAAVKTLQDAKIVIGYPDGTYGGRRPMTRYEFATAIARLLPLLNTTNTDVASKEDLAALRSDLEGRLANNEAALAALRSLVNEFAPELEKLGQDVAAIRHAPGQPGRPRRRPGSREPALPRHRRCQHHRRGHQLHTQGQHQWL